MLSCQYFKVSFEQWASKSFQCLPFPYTRRICMNFTTKRRGSELTWQVCSMLFASLSQDAFFIIRSLALRPCLLTKNRCYYVANDSLILLSASLVFKKHRCPPDLLRKATTVRSVPTRYVFYLVAFATVIQSTSTQDYLLTTGAQVFSHIIFKNVVVWMIAVRIFL